MKKSLLLGFIGLSILLTGCSGQQKSSTASYPSKPIEMIVPFAAGGATDQIARVMEKAMRKHLPNGQTIVVVNKPGGASVVGTTELAKAKPDGYRIGLVPPGPISIQPLFGNAPYTHENFQGVIRLASSPFLFAVRADSNFKTFNEWHEYVKNNPDKFIYGSGGIGNPPHVAMEQFLLAQGLKLKYVPYEGTSQAYTALLGGHVHGEITSSQELKGQVDSGQVRMLANFGTVKYDYYKDIPTLKELGFNQSTEAYYGIVVPKGVPKEIVAILHDSFKKALEDPEVIEAFKQNGIMGHYAGTEEFHQQIVRENKEYGVILKEMGLLKK